MPIKYKVLREDLRSPYMWFAYKLGVWVEEPDIGADGASECVRGLYATDIEGLLYRGVSREGEAVYRVEVAGRKAGEAPFKTCWQKLRILEKVPEAEVRQIARAEHERLGYLLEEALYPIHPFRVRPHKWTRRDQQLLKKWTSVRARVWDSVWDSVRRDVGATVWNSIWDSVWNSIWKSVMVPVWYTNYAYVGSLFPRIKTWKGIDHDPGIYPFEAGAALWRRGFVPAKVDDTWKVFGAPDGRVVWEGLV